MDVGAGSVGEFLSRFGRRVTMEREASLSEKCLAPFEIPESSSL
jgi:hypothetical protein